ncbi:Mut7-C RNAse domain containing protein, putative [Trypanosoma equiperdum]|uniref:Mut7-C RNAse domain-containing protein n=4 Tax=Trypanozoon TaxID=39700 RepID=Q382E2_TRYB2|nr:hypothetical protein, conserved [Trypanosoma brucei gambiense DAL972]XP_829451.1 hypothetical protein, conserved [Trypanosoma brucei brucei TREU927]RHW67739.1 Mut7-C RNAse domain containing protein [Trypanosoma brucei equiperdum]SCU66240.1 Mut7-C RNAse domain containing protein, putative [Trypanosoma equiperdum]EAN80339.1 hypothetical protein, conserved [Trypanosoma brucei brucei TREU927]CBH18439.1 hypothetical protein, conserved [Trypanosoma brucei gambiense DAL972]|eukprot:XP_011780703.1 hypothetical protein, conserved [Trypanosoma brucei gambiense DAL972]
MHSSPATSQDGFLLDFSLYRVAKYIRLLGYNAVCDSQLFRRDMVNRAVKDNLVLVTSSCALIEQAKAHNRTVQKHRSVIGGGKTVVAYDSDGESIYSEGDDDMREITFYELAHPTADNFFTLMVDAIRTLGLLYRRDRIFSRCVMCNEVLVEVVKEDVKEDVHPKVYEVYDAFTRCPACRKVFWGVDNGKVINYTAFRTLETLQRLFEAAMGPDLRPPRISHLCYFRSFPRRVHSTVFSYLSDADLRVLSVVVPKLKDLSDAVKKRSQSVR